VEYLHASFDDRKIMVASCCDIHDESNGRWWRPDTFVSEKKRSQGYSSFLYHVDCCVWPEIWQHSCYMQKGFHGVSVLCNLVDICLDDRGLYSCNNNLAIC
jgi:hypothetical protein